LGALIYPIKVFHSDYKNIDPVSLLEDNNKIELKDSEENRAYFIKADRYLQKRTKLYFKRCTIHSWIGKYNRVNACGNYQTIQRFSWCGRFKKYRNSLLDIYINKRPKIGFNNGKIELTDIDFRIDYKITGHIKTIFGKTHIVLQNRGAEVQANSTVALNTIGTKLFANIGFDRLKLVLDFGFKFTFDLKKYLDPKSSAFEVFDASTALLSIPSSKSKLAFKSLTPTIGNGELSVKSEFNVVAG